MEYFAGLWESRLVGDLEAWTGMGSVEKWMRCEERTIAGRKAELSEASQKTSHSTFPK